MLCRECQKRNDVMRNVIQFLLYSLPNYEELIPRPEVIITSSTRRSGQIAASTSRGMVMLGKQ